jgi:hypothetical protein
MPIVFGDSSSASGTAGCATWIVSRYLLTVGTPIKRAHSYWGHHGAVYLLWSLLDVYIEYGLILPICKLFICQVETNVLGFQYRLQMK